MIYWRVFESAEYLHRIGIEINVFVRMILYKRFHILVFEIQKVIVCENKKNELDATSLVLELYILTNIYKKIALILLALQ